MKKISILVCLLAGVIQIAFAQPKVKSAEYFWDTDPGEGKAHAVATGTPADSVHFLVTIPATGLSIGFHALYMRVYSNSFSWSIPEQNNIYIYKSVTATPPNIAAAEYFWDTDPGEGAGKPITVTTPADSERLSASISVGSLGTGFHALYVRTKTTNGNWGIVEQQEIYISISYNPLAPNITQAEYFWDTDPGEGKGKQVTVSQSADSVHLLANLSVSGLNTGFHNLYCRTKSSNGNWGIVEQREVYVYSNFTPTPPNIVVAEYFWDVDPGENKGHAMTVPTPSDSVHLVQSVSVNLQQGFHQLYIRSKDASNHWSLVDQRTIYMTDYAAAKDSIINAAEYFIDTDPGEGKATKITVANPGDTIKQAFTINIPANTDTGYHLVYVRTCTSHGLWGVTESAQIHVGKSSLPISLLYFRASLQNGQVDLNWETTTEINSSQFQVERSANGTDFTTIATVAAAGNSSVAEYYSAIDGKPLAGRSFYRLKEIDKDGKITYSMIVVIDNGAVAAPRLYPNPAQYSVHIDIPTSLAANMIIVYNNLGQPVIQKAVPENATSVDVDVTHLAGGGYHLIIFSANGSKNTLNFIKL